MKMKIGDMEMSSAEGIRFGAPDKKLEVARLSPKKEALLPEISQTQAVVAAAAAVGAILALLLAAVLLSTTLFLIPLPGLLLLTIGVFYAASRQEKKGLATSPDLSEVATERRLRLFQHLQKRGAPMTIEALQGELHWTREAIYSGLQGLLQQERITEDLDLETGHWVYELPSAVTLDFQDPQTLSLEDRIEALQQEHHSSERKS